MEDVTGHNDRQAIDDIFGECLGHDVANFSQILLAVLWKQCDKRRLLLERSGTILLIELLCLAMVDCFIVS